MRRNSSTVLSNNQTKNHLALQIRTTPYATSPHGKFSTSCCIKASTHIKNYHLQTEGYSLLITEETLCKQARHRVYFIHIF